MGGREGRRLGSERGGEDGLRSAAVSGPSVGRPDPGNCYARLVDGRPSEDDHRVDGRPLSRAHSVHKADQPGTLRPRQDGDSLSYIHYRVYALVYTQCTPYMSTCTGNEKEGVQRASQNACQANTMAIWPAVMQRPRSDKHENSHVLCCDPAGTRTTTSAFPAETHQKTRRGITVASGTPSAQIVAVAIVTSADKKPPAAKVAIFVAT